MVNAMTIDAQPAETPPAAPPNDICKLPPPQLRRQLRRLAGFTQEDVALEFGVSDGAISYWERRRPGRRYLRGYMLLLVDWAAAASASGIPVDWPPTHPITAGSSTSQSEATEADHAWRVELPTP